MHGKDQPGMLAVLNTRGSSLTHHDDVMWVLGSALVHDEVAHTRQHASFTPPGSGQC